MNWLEQLKSASLIEPLGWTILHSLWEGAAIAIIAAVFLRLTRSRSAQLRYGIACLALFSMLIAAAVTFVELRPSKVLPMASSDAPLHLIAPTIQPMPISEPIPTANQPAAVSLTDRIRPILPSLSLAWIAGVLLLGAYHAGGWMLLRRLRFQSRAIADVSSCAMLTDLIAAMHIDRTVQLCESVLVQVPTVIGWLSPIILLPTTAIIGLSPSELRGLLAHELAHIRRHDYLVNLLQTVIETLLFYHPATWWLGKVIRQERENCCDDLAASVCDRTIYAQALATMESLRQSPQLALSAKGAALLPRIRRILGLPSSPTRRSLSSGFVSFSILVAVVVGAVLLNACRSNAKTPTTKSVQPTTQSDVVYSDPTASDLIAPPNDPYRIVQSDVLNVVINDLQAKGTQSTETKRVNNDGDISLPMIGFVHAAGKTESEFEKAIATKYQDAKYLNPAVVSVTVVEGRGRTFSIRGDVDQPGQYAIPKADFRLKDAIEIAHGVNSSATAIYVVRNQAAASDRPQRIIRILLDDLRDDPDHYNVVIYPNDLLQLVPEPVETVLVHSNYADLKVTALHVLTSSPNEEDLRPSNRAASETGTYTMLGQVGRPGQFNIPSDNLRLLDAIAQSGGANPVATSAAVCRGDSDTTRIIYVPLDQLRSKPEAFNVVIYPKDRIVVGLFSLMVTHASTRQADSTTTQAANPSEASQFAASINFAGMSVGDESLLLKDLLTKQRDLVTQLIDAKQRYGANNPAVTGLQKRLGGIQEEKDAIREDLDVKVEKSMASSATTQPIDRANPPPPGSVYYVSGMPRAGVYEMGERHITIFQALTTAGLSASSSGNLVAVTHEQGGHDVYAIPNLRQHDNQVAVRPGDMLMVVQRPIVSQEYYVGGDVPRVGVYQIPPQGINVLQAIITAGADPFKTTDSEVEIRHSLLSGKLEVHKTTIDDLMNAVVKQPSVQPDDQIFVHNSSTATTQGSAGYGRYEIDGDVPSPGTYAMPNGEVGILDAIKAAGAKPSAIGDDTAFIQRDRNGDRERMSATVKSLMDDSQGELTIERGDIIRIVKPAAKSPDHPFLVSPTTNPSATTAP